MPSDIPQHGDRVRELLAAVDGDRQALLRLGISVRGKSGDPFFPVDLLMFGALKRSVSTAAAIVMMVESHNMVCARTLLRTHIDTSLRFSAAWLVEKPHEFAAEVLRGERIDKLKSRDGKRLTDGYLVEVHAKDHPWLPDVYTNLSGYVHFSGSHIFDSIDTLGQNGEIQFQFTAEDLNFPEASWIEVLECFREATEILEKYLRGYRVTKSMSPEQLAEARGED
jgi:hypothetical protein